MKYRIKNGFLLLQKKDEFVVQQQDIFINGNIIASVGHKPDEGFDNYEDIDARNQLVMPGLINSHTHAYMSFMRNYADELPLDRWLKRKIFPVEAAIQESDFYWATMLGCMEMISTGTTSFLDMYIREKNCVHAVSDSGMRAYMGRCITGEDLYGDGYNSFKNAMHEKEEYESDILKFVLSPHSIYSCSSKMLCQIDEEAKKNHMLKHIHLSESEKEICECMSAYGETPVGYLNGMGFLDNRTIAAHCVEVNDNDIELLSVNGVNVVTNPASNAKLGNGTAPVIKMLESGVNVCLGTDSAASNNTLNMFREMNFFSLIHKAKNKTSFGISTTDVLRSATVNPACAFGEEGALGVVSEGAFADLIFLDLKATSLFPYNNMISSLCYSANGSEVASVMVNGKFLMKNKEFTTIDSERVFFEVNRTVNKYL